METARTYPYHQESEEALLGSILINPEVIYNVSEIIKADDFFIKIHRQLYEVLLDLNVSGKPIDVVSASERMEEIGAENIDRPIIEHITHLSNIVPNSANAKHYASVVERMSTKRKLIKAGEEVSKIGYSEDKESHQLVDQADSLMYKLALNTKSLDMYKPVNTLLVDAFDRIRKLHENEHGIRGLKTGIKSLDNRLSGLQKSDLIILAARPGMGKTTFAMDIARSAAKGGGKVGIFSLEMSGEQLVDRLIASESNVDAWKLRVGNLKSDIDFTSVSNAIQGLSSLPIYIDDRAGNSISSIRSSIRKMKKENDIEIAIIDYLQLITPENNTTSNISMVQQITEISRSLKQIARELNIPVLALSQLSRNIEQRGGVPRLSDLRDSGSIEQDADVVMFIHRDKQSNEEEESNGHTVKVLIEKHRNGPIGNFEIFFNKKIVSFQDLDTQHSNVDIETDIE